MFVAPYVADPVELLLLLVVVVEVRKALVRL